MKTLALSRAEWRKSSYRSQSGNCVEVATTCPARSRYEIPRPRRPGPAHPSRRVARLRARPQGWLTRWPSFGHLSAPWRQLNGLPSVVFDALVEPVVALVEEPWMPAWWHQGMTRLTVRPSSAAATGCCPSTLRTPLS